MTYVNALRRGQFLVVLNQNTIIGCYESFDAAMDMARGHSSQIARGMYEIFEMPEPLCSGQVGESLKWTVEGRPQRKELKEKHE